MNGTNQRYARHLLAHPINLPFELFEAVFIKSIELLRERKRPFYQISTRETHIEREFDS